MEETLAKLVNECREYMKLKALNRSSSFLSQGSPAYLISKEWLKKYKEYILIQDVKRHKKPEIAEDHVAKLHPGRMTNEEDLCEDSNLNLKGTGTAPFEKSVVDTYLKPNLLERRDYKVYNANLWNFLN